MTEHTNENERMTEILRETMTDNLSPSLEERLQKEMREFRGGLAEHPYVKQLGRETLHDGFRVSAWLSSPRFAWIAGTACMAAVILGAIFGGGGTPTWAEVVEEFKSVDFLNVNLYYKENALAEPKQIEVWLGRGGKIRGRFEHTIFFAERGEILKVFDLHTRGEIEPHPMLGFLLPLAGVEETFSLNNLLQGVPGELSGLIPVPNENADAAEDLVVFDVTSGRTPEWVRIWALKESRLPVRFRFWDPRQCESTDAVFSYSKDQPENFFDPAAFEKALHEKPRVHSSGSAANVAYALLKDPGGRPYTPADIHTISGYHMPTVEDAGMTPDGIVWIVAGRAENCMPDSASFYGFAELRDDLGRAYIHNFVKHEASADRSYDLYIPLDYGPGTERPAVLTAVCKVESEHPYAAKYNETIGTVEITEWKRDAPFPDEFSPRQQEMWHPLIALADHLFREKQWDRLEEILDAIPGDPANDKSALIREQIRLESRGRRKDYDAVIQIAEALMPVMREKIYASYNRSTFAFEEYILALISTGRREEAKRAFEGMRAELTHSRLEIYNGELENFAMTLSNRIHMTVDEIGGFLDIDVKTDGRLEHFTGWDWHVGMRESGERKRSG